MAQPSHKEMLDHIQHDFVSRNPEASETAKIAYFKRKTGLSRAAYYDIKNGKPLVQKAKRNQLEGAYKDVVASKGDELHQKFEAAAYSASTTQVDEHYGPLGLTFLDEVTNDALLPAPRILKGIVGQKIIFDWIKYRQDNEDFEPSWFVLPTEELQQRGRLAVEALKKLIDEHEEAPLGLFPQAANQPFLLARSYRLLRARFQSDFMGWQFTCAQTIEERTEQLKKDHNRQELARDFQWMHSLQPDEVGWLYMPFVIACHADDWVEAMRLLPKLMQYFPDITASVEGIKPLISDPDVLPGVAAALVYANDPNLDNLREQLSKLRAERAVLDHALRELSQAIQNSRPYVELYKIANNALGA